ncbi:proton channel OTOP3-like isoform X1 [Paramisgurnus dabryanus]|uniref:proton channel OTOP3-like isoform X1 n=1 Tax=Paramisgurnus dabryanus TaxID=90735 RepID=UPI0031F4160A
MVENSVINLSSKPVDCTTDLDRDENPVVSSVHGTNGLARAMLLVPSGRGLISGLLGLNLVLFGGCLVTGDAFQLGEVFLEPEVFVLILMVLSMIWMLWFLLWARRLPGISPYTDHHAGGATVTGVLLLFAGSSLLLCVFMMGYNIFMTSCRSIGKLLLPFIEAPFLFIQTYLLWAHSKDCTHIHTMLTRSGLMLTLSTDVLLWFRAVTQDAIHLEIEMGNQILPLGDINNTDLSNSTRCRCAQRACVVLQKSCAVLYPFNLEFCLMAGCMLYVMWKNVGRRVTGGHQTQKITLHRLHDGGVLLGPVLGLLVLLTGVTVFVLYQVFVDRQAQRNTAFLLFYGFHLGLIPVMVLSTFVGTVIQTTQKMGEGHISDDGTQQVKNPTRSLDVVLLLGAALGQLSLSYLSVVAGLSLGPNGIMGNMDMSFSILSLLELLMQNVFIIQRLQSHPNQPHKDSRCKKTEKGQKERNVTNKEKGEHGEKVVDTTAGDVLFDEGNNTPEKTTDRQETRDHHYWNRRIIKEIAAFLIMSNIMLWVISAFGAHPQFENGVGKKFYGFSAWFILVNLCQPLTVFYRMHSVGVLMEILISA